MIEISNKKLEDVTAGGVHGSYVKLSPSVGIKLIHSIVFRSMRKAHKSFAWREANLEAELLSAAFDSGVVPHCYGATIVKVKSGFRVGVLMQHLGSTTLANSEFYDAAEVSEEINDRLEDLGIYHGDLHEDNIMIYRGKFYAVDFSPHCVNMEE